MTFVTTAGDVSIPDEKRQRCEVYTRVTGYYRPTSEFNIGKKGEEAERVFFDVGSMVQ